MGGDVAIREPIRRLSKSLSAELWAGRAVTSYEDAASLLVESAVCAGALHLSLDISPAALRLTLVDDAPELGRKPPTALTLVASVDVASRQGDKLLCASSTGDDGSDAQQLLPCGADATVTDVWELFRRLPVRRQAALSCGDGALAASVRGRCAAIALAHPKVSFLLRCTGDVILQTPGASGLTRDVVRSVLGRLVTEPLVSVVSGFGGPVEIEGFISKRPALPGLEAQIISLDRVPLRAGSDMHKLVCGSWRNCLDDNIRVSQSRQKPLCVLNVLSRRRIGDFVSSETKEANIRIFNATEITNHLEFIFRQSLTSHTMQVPSRTLILNNTRQFDLHKYRQRKLVRSKPVAFRPAKLELCSAIVSGDRQGDAMHSSDVFEHRPMRSGALTRRLSNGVHGKSKVKLSPRSRQPSVRSRTFHIRRPRSGAEVRKSYASLAPSWRNPCFPSGGCNMAPAVNMLLPQTASARPSQLPATDVRAIQLARADLRCVRIVGQADSKFIIVTSSSGILYAMDQHAASERLHFESLQRRVRNRVPTKTSTPSPTQDVIELSPRHASTYRTNEDHFRRWGWELVLDAGVGVALTEARIMSVPNIPDVCVSLEKPHQLLEHLNDLGGGASASGIPRPVLDALATAACHNAVRFGDTLSIEQCTAIVRGLAECELPFSCAHGRPSVVPLVCL